MNQLCFVGVSAKDEDRLRKLFAGLLESEFRTFADLGGSAPGAHTVIDFDLNDITNIPTLRDWIKRKPDGAKIIFVADKGSHLQLTRAYAVGATDVVHRPIEPRILVAKVLGDVAALSNDATDEAIKKSPGASAAVNTLQNIFSSACLGQPLDTAAANTASDTVIGQVEAQGLGAWIDLVRNHHSMTYQHCLLVTGVAVAFGQRLGISRADRRRLSFAGMLHDIGKARIPLAILEKPGPLDKDELAVMRKHPEYGLEALKTAPGLSPEMIDMVVHHHEYLDGSGYPHGLGSGEISDLVRMITIADVFGALIEARSYKPPMSGDAAYKILLDMGPKLDKDMVREFQTVTRLGRAIGAHGALSSSSSESPFTTAC